MVVKNTHAARSQCPIACGLDIVGDHWSLLIVRDLLFFGHHEYKDMLEGGEGISSNILSDRLAKLQQAELLKSIPHPESKKRKFYYLTPKGKDLVYVLISIAMWSTKYASDSVKTAFDEEVTNKGPKEFARYLLLKTEEWEHQYGIEFESEHV